MANAFLSDAIAEIEGLREVNRDFCKKQMAEKASPALPTNCAVVPKGNTKAAAELLPSAAAFQCSLIAAERSFPS